MKTLGCVFAGILCAMAQGATSDILFATGGGTFNGAPGNVIFNGQHFVTPTVQTNGAIHLTFLDTNGMAVSNLSLSITGSSPRIVRDGEDYLLAWLDTSDVASVLFAARLSQGSLSSVMRLATNVTEETVSLSAAAGEVLAVWQSMGSNSAVLARSITFSGAPNGSAFVVSPSVQPQRYPSVDNDGTNHLVCWMEQNAGGLDFCGSNFWRVEARYITQGIATGMPFTVSATNSLSPYFTACSFGTNFLVIWSSDHIYQNSTVFPCATNNAWQPAIHGRMVRTGPVSGESVLVGNPHGLHSMPLNPASNQFWHVVYANTNAAVAFGGGNYLLGEPNPFGPQRVQPLAADGAQRQFAIPGTFLSPANATRIAYGAGRFCAFYGTDSFSGYSVTFGPASAAEPTLTNLRRATNGGIAVDGSAGSALQVSTNFVIWSRIDRAFLPTWTNFPQLFVRAINSTWTCIENMRMIDWAKKRRSFDYLIHPQGYVNDVDLYFTKTPECPENGVYTLGRISEHPTCTIVGHTL